MTYAKLHWLKLHCVGCAVRTTHIGCFGAHGAPYLTPFSLAVNTVFPFIEHHKGIQQRQRLFCVSPNN
jgi:hypothetical protein